MMSAPIVGFICALVLAVLVLVWIAYCMFFREKHKSEAYQYDISDLRHRNYLIAQEQEAKLDPVKTTLVGGCIILPSHHKHKDECYDKRPDYPEAAAPILRQSTHRLDEVFADDTDDDVIHYKEEIIETVSHSNSHHHSDV